MPESGTKDIVGQTLGGRYVVERRLGAGGMGAVYAARDLVLNGKLVAIKIPRPDLADDPAIKARWEAEIGKLIDIEPHPHIVHVQDRGLHEGIPYIVMEYEPGGDLKGKLEAAGGRMSPDGVLEWIGPAAAALDHLHALGIVHRDVKPGNFVFDKRGNVFVTDFGIAKALDGPALTRTGVLPGTTLYMAPEATEGRFEPAYDQYAFATTVYECLSGTFPFTADDPFVLLSQKTTQNPRPLSEVVPDLPPGLSECVIKALERRPEKRFKTCTEFAEEFRHCVQPFGPGPSPLKLIALVAGSITLALVAGVIWQLARPATVMFATTPTAFIALNGGAETPTPLTRGLSRGQSSTVRVSRPGYVTREEQVTPSRWRMTVLPMSYTLEPACAKTSPEESAGRLLVRFDDVDLDTEKQILGSATFLTAVGPGCAIDATVRGGVGYSVQDRTGTAVAPPSMADSAERARAVVEQLSALLVRKTLDGVKGNDDSVAVRFSPDESVAGGADPASTSSMKLKDTMYVYLRSTEPRYLLAFSLDANGAIGLLYPTDLDAAEAPAPKLWFKARKDDFVAASSGQTAVYAWSSTVPWARFLGAVHARDLAVPAGAPPNWGASTTPPAMAFAQKLIDALSSQGRWAAGKQVIRVD